jgi:type I restriction enzyme S subunit
MREKEGLFDLPENWSWTIASEVCASVRDGTHDTPKYVEKGIPLITSKNLREGEIDFSTAKFITLEDHQQISIRSGVEDGDVLFAMIGTVGNPVLVKTNKEFSIKNVALFKKNDSVIDSRYLKSWLSSFTLDKLLEKQGLLKGTTQKFIPLGNLRNLPTPLPPLNEQRRIVAKIEALKARSQRVKEELEAIPALLDQFRQSVLAAAFRGELTADWREKNPDVEPASVLLERIRAERRRRWEEAELEKMKAQGKTPKDDKWKEKYKEPELINQEDFQEIPEGWCWVKLEELVSDIPRSMQSGPFGSNLLHSEFQDTGILAIGIDNVLDGRFTLGSQHRISLEKYKELEKYTARPLDVLITVMSTVGRCCVVPPDIETAIITKHVYRIFPEHKLINSYFLMNALRGSTAVLRQIRGEIRGQTRPGINGETLRNLIIPVPPRLEQEQILAALNENCDSMNRVSRILNELAVETSLLDQSILAKAFRGELVPQDPNDEPASVLLERIRAEREKLDTKKKAKGKTEKKSRKAKPEPAEPEQLSLPGFE